MKCPHCSVAFHPNTSSAELVKDVDGYWSVDCSICPTCERVVIQVKCFEVVDAGNVVFPGDLVREFTAWPRTIGRSKPSSTVPKDLAEDYSQAAAVLDASPKASAALSRRCLQHLLHQYFGIHDRDLAREIQALLDSNRLPTHLADGIDAVRVIGNFAAHPIKSTNTDAVVDVEPGEAEWLLDILEGLFDFCYVQPATQALKREALNQKLAAASKAAMKQST